MLEELVTDPQLPAVALVPAGVLDDQHRADFVAQGEQVDGHAGVQQGRIAGLEVEPMWWDRLRASTIVAPGAAAVELGLQVARAVVS